MFKWVKKLFIFEEPPSSPLINITNNEERKYGLIGRIQQLLQRDDINEILTNEIVGTYLLEMGYGSLEELVGLSPLTNNNITFIIPVSKYFDTRLGDGYSVLKYIENYLSRERVSDKVLDDVEIIVGMFDFYTQ